MCVCEYEYVCLHTGGAGFGDVKDSGHGYGGIDGVATFFEHVEAGLGGEGLGGSDHACACACVCVCV